MARISKPLPRITSATTSPRPRRMPLRGLGLLVAPSPLPLLLRPVPQPPNRQSRLSRETVPRNGGNVGVKGTVDRPAASLALRAPSPTTGTASAPECLSQPLLCGSIDRGLICRSLSIRQLLDSSGIDYHPNCVQVYLKSLCWCFGN